MSLAIRATLLVLGLTLGSILTGCSHCSECNCNTYKDVACGVIDKFDFPGRTVSAYTLESCCYACTEEKKCNTFTYDAVARTCKLYIDDGYKGFGCGPPSRKKGAISGRPANTQCNVQDDEGNVPMGNLVGKKDLASAGECCDWCKDTIGCWAYVFDAAGQPKYGGTEKCLLLHSSDDGDYVPGAIWGQLGSPKHADKAVEQQIQHSNHTFKYAGKAVEQRMQHSNGTYKHVDKAVEQQMQPATMLYS